LELFKVESSKDYRQACRRNSKVEILSTKDKISADLEIIKGLHREHEDGYTSSMKPPL
jgi:hypothetical protein